MYNIVVGDYMERVQKIIASSGLCSRRRAEELIKKGLVTVNGEISVLGSKAKYSDNILVNGKSINKEEKVYFLLNKPRGVVSSVKDDKGRRTVVDLIDTTKRIYPVGRLDYDTTGAIILTNDGELANILMHPKNEIERSYYAKVEGLVTKEEISSLKGGIIIDGVKCYPKYIKVKKYDSTNNISYVSLVLKEGHNHEVKNIFKTLGHSVIKLKREYFAFLDVNNLKSGEYRKLNLKEIKRLYSYQKTKKDNDFTD